jgi:hypothetical protein
VFLPSITIPCRAPKFIADCTPNLKACRRLVPQFAVFGLRNLIRSLPSRILRWLLGGQ